MNLALFASGGGSNVQAIINAIESGALPARAVLLISDRPGAGALARAGRHGIRTQVLPPSEYPDQEAFSRALLSALEDAGADFVALAGYLRHIPPGVVSAFRHRMVNVHPSLLPAFGGTGFYGRRVHEAALEYGVRWTGVTVHLVDNDFDTGPIVLQEPVPVEDNDTPESLAERVLLREHELYPRALALFAAGRVRVEGRRVTITPPPSSQTLKNAEQH